MPHELRRKPTLLVSVLCLVLVGCSQASDADQQAGALTSAPLMAAPDSGALPESVNEALSAVLAGWLEAAGLPGVTAAAVTPAGSWTGEAGVDGAGEPLVPESAMSIASITKTSTAAEVMLLSAHGLVDLDAPITVYVDLPFDARDATVRQLLNMSSGFPP